MKREVERSKCQITLYLFKRDSCDEDDPSNVK